MTERDEKLRAITEILASIRDKHINGELGTVLCSSLNGFKFLCNRFHSTYMYPHGKLFVFCPYFKKQRLFVHAIFKKYSNVMDIEKILNISHFISISDFIYNTSKIPLCSIINNENLKNTPNSYDVLEEAVILGNYSILDIPQHPYSNRKKDFKERYLEFLIYCICSTNKLFAMQLAFIEKTAIDFSISSLQTKEYFRASLSASQADRQRVIQNFLATDYFASSNQREKDGLRIVELMDKNNQTKRYNVSNKKMKTTMLKYIVDGKY